MPDRPSAELKVFIATRESKCDECHEELGSRAWIVLGAGGRAFCLACAELDHLVFLPTGDAALTRQSRQHSALSAVVLKWSRARKRYECQGLLVEEPALIQAEAECLSDAEARARRREREADRRAEFDRDSVRDFEQRVRELFPNIPSGREMGIAEHACLKYSGRVGRSAAAKALDSEAVRLAVAAHARHHETDYDRLLARGWERLEARHEVDRQVREILQAWEGKSELL